VVDSFNAQFGWGISGRNVLITPGSQALYFFALNCFSGYGQGQSRSIVLPLCPEYTGYEGAVFDGSVLQTSKPVLEILSPHQFKYRVNLDALNFNDSVGAVLFSRPCNPSGNVLSDEEVRGIVEAASACDIPVLIDSAYAPPFPAMAFTAMEHIWRENVILCFSLSKAGLPGERVGIAIADERFIAVLESFQSNANLHSSRYGQAIAAKAIASGELAHLSSSVIKPYYQQKFSCIEAALTQTMPRDIPWFLHKGEGSVFAWLWLKDLPISDLDLYQELKKEGVIVVPGSSFFPGLKEAWTHRNECIRISLTATEEEIQLGVAIIAQVIKRVYNT
jgi:valine--pyruvate aminotransferase